MSQRRIDDYFNTIPRIPRPRRAVSPPQPVPLIPQQPMRQMVLDDFYVRQPPIRTTARDAFRYAQSFHQPPPPPRPMRQRTLEEFVLPPPRQQQFTRPQFGPRHEPQFDPLFEQNPRPQPPPMNHELLNIQPPHLPPPQQQFNPPQFGPGPQPRPRRTDDDAIENQRRRQPTLDQFFRRF